MAGLASDKGKVGIEDKDILAWMPMRNGGGAGILLWDSRVLDACEKCTSWVISRSHYLSLIHGFEVYRLPGSPMQLNLCSSLLRFFSWLTYGYNNRIRGKETSFLFSSSILPPPNFSFEAIQKAYDIESRSLCRRTCDLLLVFRDVSVYGDSTKDC